MAGELIPSDFDLGYYEFTGQVGGEIIDLSGQGYNLPVIGAIDIFTGPFNNGLELDGINDQAISAQARFSGLTQMSVVLVVKCLANASGVDAIYWKGTLGQQDYLVYLNGNTTPRYRLNSAPDLLAGGNLGTADYHLIVTTFDGDLKQMSVDGATFSTAARTAILRDSGDFVLGAITGNTNNCNMVAAQLGIIDGVLTQDNVDYMWNGGAFRQLGAVGPSFNPSWARNSNQVIGAAQ